MIWFLMACVGTGSVSIDPNVTPEGGDDTATDTGDGPSWDPTGDWSGTFDVEIYWSAWDWGDDCSDRELDVTVDGDQVQGYAACYFDWQDEGGLLFELLLDGRLDDEHQLQADVDVSLNNGAREDNSDATGDFSAENATVEGEDDMTAYNETMDYAWELDLQLD